MLFLADGLTVKNILFWTDVLTVKKHVISGIMEFGILGFQCNGSRYNGNAIFQHNFISINPLKDTLKNSYGILVFLVSFK